MNTAYKKIIIQCISLCICSNLFAANGGNCPWVPDSRVHKSQARIGSFTSVPGPANGLNVYFEYTVSWEARKCENFPLEYQKLTWTLGARPQNQPFSGPCSINYTAVIGGQTLPTVAFAVANGQNATWSVVQIHQTKAQNVDKMELNEIMPRQQNLCEQGGSGRAPRL